MKENIISSTKPHQVSLDNHRNLAAQPRTQRVAEPRLDVDQNRLIHIPASLAQPSPAEPSILEPVPARAPKALSPVKKQSQITNQNQDPLISAALVRRISELQESNQRLRGQTEILRRSLPRDSSDALKAPRRQLTRTSS
jgi:hypothetical protein